MKLLFLIIKMAAPWVELDSDAVIVRNNLDVQGDLQFSSSSGTAGQIILKTGANTQAWSNFPQSITPAIAKLSLPIVVNVNSGNNTFIGGSVSLVNNPFSFNPIDGTLTANITGLFRYHFVTTLSNGLAQTKFVLKVGSTTVSAQKNAYIPMLNVAQPFHATDTFNVTSGNIVTPTFITDGVGGTISNSGLDPDSGLSTTYIILEKIYIP